LVLAWFTLLYTTAVVAAVVAMLSGEMEASKAHQKSPVFSGLS
jgi:hypothetical protein